MKNWMIMICAIVLLGGCTKYTTPRKVERRISDGSWTISSFSVNGESVALLYAGYNFNFGEEGNIKVSGEFSANGSWELGLNRNPAILYLSFPPVGGLEYLSDDWQVAEMKKDLMRLERNDSSGEGGTLVFRK